MVVYVFLISPLCNVLNSFSSRRFKRLAVVDFTIAAEAKKFSDFCILSAQLPCLHYKLDGNDMAGIQFCVYFFFSFNY